MATYDRQNKNFLKKVLKSFWFWIKMNYNEYINNKREVKKMKKEKEVYLTTEVMIEMFKRAFGHQFDANTKFIVGKDLTEEERDYCKVLKDSCEQKDEEIAELKVKIEALISSEIDDEDLECVIERHPKYKELKEKVERQQFMIEVLEKIIINKSKEYYELDAKYKSALKQINKN